MGMVDGVIDGVGLISLGGDEGFSKGFAISVFGNFGKNGFVCVLEDERRENLLTA